MHTEEEIKEIKKQRRIYDLRNYYPTHWSGCNPIHAVTDWSYVRRLVRAALRGEKINPIIIQGSIGNGWLLTGTHRAAANDILMMLDKEEYLIPYINFEDIEATEAMIEANDNCDYETLDWIFDR